MPVVCEPRVHNEQTSIQNPSPPTYGEQLRHSCYPAFLAASEVYAALDAHLDRPRSDRLESCRSLAWFYRHTDTGEVRVGSNSCRLRWCPVCAAKRRNYIAHSVATWLSDKPHPKFLTLTLRHSDAPLQFQVDCLYKSFRELRRRKEFSRCVTGGVWFFQIKKSKNDNRWHPHLHCLVTGLYLSKHKLHRMWCQVTFGSFVADIKSIHDPQSAANDAARYAASPGSLVGLSLADGCELVGAMHGRRICGTWGTGRALSLRPPVQPDKDKWVNVGSWSAVFRERHANPNAQAILSAWKDCRPLPEGISLVLDGSAVSEAVHKILLKAGFESIYDCEEAPP